MTDFESSDNFIFKKKKTDRKGQLKTMKVIRNHKDVGFLLKKNWF